MMICKVTGLVTAPAHIPALDGAALVLVQIPGGGTLVAVDPLGAAVGSHVLVCQGEAAQAALGGRCPVDAAVTGIVLE
ncbi:MAG: ethanolamine utilization protein EutN [Clostridiales bacterium]|nr:ethanolamine utilization protein EutN [Clostridiales bacterium]MCD7887537.1 ethanolamine utilization protein EutN [Clostridiales bacterium]